MSTERIDATTDRLLGAFNKLVEAGMIGAKSPNYDTAANVAILRLMAHLLVEIEDIKSEVAEMKLRSMPFGQ